MDIGMGYVKIVTEWSSEQDIMMGGASRAIWLD